VGARTGLKKENYILPITYLQPRNVPIPVPITELKEGELYFEVISSNNEYYFYVIKIKKNKLEPESEKLLVISYSTLKNYNIFSEIIDFNTVWNYSSVKYDFIKMQIIDKSSSEKTFFYEFDKEWFLKNKQKILSYMNSTYYSSSKKSFPRLVHHIEKLNNPSPKKIFFNNIISTIVKYISKTIKYISTAKKFKQMEKVVLDFLVCAIIYIDKKITNLNRFLTTLKIKI